MAAVQEVTIATMYTLWIMVITESHGIQLNWSLASIVYYIICDSCQYVVYIM